MKKTTIDKNTLAPNETIKELKQLFLLLLICVPLVFYIKSYMTARKELLSKNPRYAIGKITGGYSVRNIVLDVEYKVNNKTYEAHALSSRNFEIGEFYYVKYLVADPENYEVLWNSPFVKDYRNYEEVIGEVVYKSKDNTIIGIKYNYRNHIYIRDVIVVKKSNYKLSKSYPILVNKKNPKISYFKNEINRRDSH